MFVWSLIGAAVALFVLATMPNLSWAVVFTVWLGAFCGLAWVSGYTLLQENVVDEYRGRTFGALTTMSRMVLFLSLAAVPDAGADLPVDRASRRLDGVLRGGPADRPVGLAPGPVGGGRAGRGRGAQHAPVAQAVPSVATRPAHPRAETEATARHRPVHRLRRRGGRRQGHPDRHGRGVPPLAGDGRARDPRARRHADRGADPRSPAGSGDRRPRRSRRGAAVRGLARADGGERDPAGARRGQGRDLRPLRRLVARVSGMGARARRAGRALAQRVGDPGVVPRPRDPAARRTRDRARALAPSRPTGSSRRGRRSSRRSPTRT